MQNTSLKFQTAVIYARYSSHSQRDVAIEQQIRACRQFAEKNGLEVVGTYEDHALTGRSDKRPGFQKMIQDAPTADWSYIIVYTLDRFSRDRYDSAIYKHQLREAGVRVLSAMENISHDPSGVLMEGLLESLAEYYSKELAQKIRRGMNDNASKCLVNGGVPLGYYRGPDGRYAVDENEAVIVREIFEKISKGVRICDLQDDLNGRGILTKTGHPWNRSSFSKMLSNERYTGVYIYGETRIPGGVPQIISKDLFDQVQTVLSTKKNPRALGPLRRRQENGLYMLTGKIFCGHCKEPMVGISGHSKQGPSYFYYVCKGKRMNHNCKMKNVPRDQIEYQVASALRNAMMTDDAITQLADAAIAYQDEHLLNSDIGPLKDQLQEVERGISNLVAAAEAGIFTSSTQSRLLELEHKQKVIKTQLSAAQQDAQSLPTREEIIATMMIYKDGDVRSKAFQQALIDAFLVAAYVYDDHLKIVFHLDTGTQETSLPFNIDDITFDVSNPDTISKGETSIMRKSGHQKRSGIPCGMPDLFCCILGIEPI